MACIAIDYDGTIADTNAVKSRWIRDTLGLEVPAGLCDRSSCVPLVGLAAYERLAAVAYEREMSEDADPVAGAREALARLARTAELFVLTARLPHRVAFARAWLEAQDLAGLFSDVISSDGTAKQAVCAELGAAALVDDDVRHLEGLASQGRKGVLFKPRVPTPIRAPHGVVVCRSWPEAVAQISGS